jgi:Winged helix DNA-binding domain
MIDKEHRGLSVTGARFVLVDGRVAGTWTATGASVTVTPLVRFTRADRTAVGEEARALAVFLGDGARPKVTVAASPR